MGLQLLSWPMLELVVAALAVGTYGLAGLDWVQLVFATLLA
jgi:hypothetical protein